MDLSDLSAELQDRNFNPDYLNLAKLGGGSAAYIPWMQATYIMVATKEAVGLLPSGADVPALTYDQLVPWASAVNAKQGGRRLGFPAHQDGLLKRFFQGHTYPSFTAGVVPVPDRPQGPGLRPPCCWGWPSPRAPRTRRRASSSSATSPSRTRRRPTLREAGFFPPTATINLPSDLNPGIQAEAKTVQAQTGSDKALPSLLPIGLKDKTEAYDDLFRTTFTAIVLRNQPIQSTLESKAKEIQTLLDSVKAPCWQPDPPSTGTCKVG
jgi:multiple sugar transport system substrate-binding protein